MTKSSRLLKKMASQKMLYIMILPCMILTFIFSYYPLSGWIMAFQNYKPAKGYSGSEFVGLAQFRFLFGDLEFWRAMRNTVAMSLMNLVFGFVFAIVFALLLNEIRVSWFKRLTQTVSYLPHFLSWVIVCSLVSNMLSTNDGAVNNLLLSLGIIDKPILWLGEEKYFWWVVAFANIWKEMGWNSIIYIAAMAGIDPSLYEVASLDGAGRFRRMWHVTLPGIRPTIVVLLIMNLGWVLNAGFEVQYLLGGGLLQDVSQTIDIFVLKYGINIGNYSLATAAGMFKSAISILLVFGANKLANKLGENSLM
ncbi:MAG: ABC transporter permease [Oscillospiraceae bacterium]